jgi:hypothetical protein
MLQCTDIHRTLARLISATVHFYEAHLFCGRTDGQTALHNQAFMQLTQNVQGPQHQLKGFLQNFDNTRHIICLHAMLLSRCDFH